MRPILKKVEDQLIRDLKETTLTFQRLGEKYGVTRQAVFGFCDRRGIKRLNRIAIEHTKRCSICKSLIGFARHPHSDFVTSHTIKAKLGIKDGQWGYHLSILKRKGLVSQKFGRLQSRKAERAYKIYFKKRLPVKTIGRQVGFKNFYAIIKEHRALGWDVPKPLFTYDLNDRKNTIARMNGNKKRGS